MWMFSLTVVNRVSWHPYRTVEMRGKVTQTIVGFLWFQLCLTRSPDAEVAK